MNKRMKNLLEDPKNRRLYEQERLITWATETVCQAMKDVGKTKANLAEELETSRAHVTQVLGGTRNMTLRTLSDLAFACGARVRVDFEPLRFKETSEHSFQRSKTPKPSSFEIRRVGDGHTGLLSSAETAAWNDTYRLVA